MRRPNIKRRVAVAGGTAVIAAAGVGGYLAMGGGTANVHLTAAQAPAAAAPAAPAAAGETDALAPDTDNLNVQQGDQSGAGDTSGATGTSAAGTTTAAGAEAPSTEPDSAGGNADPAGSAGQDGNFNN